MGGRSALVNGLGGLKGSRPKKRLRTTYLEKHTVPSKCDFVAAGQCYRILTALRETAENYISQRKSKNISLNAETHGGCATLTGKKKELNGSALITEISKKRKYGIIIPYPIFMNF
ncbi:hypothetical protein RF11_06667 [Thelohanellus kitauei]|uniref:Uncharacterized protein n=1 Tax=Thelohanellus kitauei TaxID=669202 RepID=A0A0C2J3L1_THEKT|nr:hypothetical protein RF11_06667 [Thelohanellus kitauei]